LIAALTARLNASFNASLAALPIHAALPDLLQAMQQHANVVLHAPPGAGKSTGVPLALLDANFLSGKIVMLEPRRIAARSVATRMATTLGETVGHTVGYRTRLDTKVSATTRIEVVTEGILTRMLQHDAALEGVSAVIFDEFHERSLQADLGLALCLDIQTTLRDDLKLLVMSATLDGAAVSKLLGDAPIISSEGRAWPVTTHYRSVTTRRLQDGDMARDVAGVIQRILEAEHGDVLVFLPGQGEIRRTLQFLHDSALPPDIKVLPLYGELSADEQDRAIQAARAGERKVVLATNLAETSLTIEGVRIVIDSGLERRLRFDPVTGMNGLELLRISRASSDQRRGRAGRTQEGVCYRLWIETEQASLNAQSPAEILESDLLPLALELACWGIINPAQLRWLDAPPAAHFNQAHDLLTWLGALDNNQEHGRITAHGREMARLATHPRLAHMLIKARERDLGPLACEIAALLSERDVLRRKDFQRDVDMRSRIEALHDRLSGHELDQGAKQRVLRSAQQLQKQLRATGAAQLKQMDHTGVLLASAYPDRIAQRRGNERNRYLLSNGRGATLMHAQTLGNADYLVVAQLDAGEREAQIYLAAPLTLDDIIQTFAEQIKSTTRIEWSERDECVIAVQEKCFHALTLQTIRLDKPDVEAVQHAMLQGIRQLGLGALNWTDAATSLRTRMLFAQQHDSRANPPWPIVDDQTLIDSLDTWLAPWLTNTTRRTQLQQVDIHEALQALLDWNQQQRLNEIAPTHLSVPSGSRIPLDYSSGTPTLSVRLQEVFGMVATPRIGGGKVPVLMELLSPARRPVQVTQDLASFWARGYHDVKKDLKGRYPKHYWPDDPLQAQATARAKPRGT
jgi:ATP-dependent helicase HrpB